MDQHFVRKWGRERDLKWTELGGHYAAEWWQVLHTRCIVVLD